LVQVTSPTDRAGLAEEQAALRRVATLVAQQPSPQEVFTAVTEAVGPLLGADLAAMLVFRGDGTVRLIAAFTEPVATAIANAAARRELERVAAEQQAFRSAATLVASGAAATEVFAAITTSASDVGNARAFDGGTEQMEVWT
jgi:hypothetical protein